jgi:predicted metal-dependent hydrolase
MDHRLNIHLIRSKKRRKTLSLRIKENGGIVLSVPYYTPKGEIERFIKEKESWVIKKISEKERSIRESKKAFIPGETFLYLGESYPLEIRELDHQEPPLKLSFGKFILHQGRIKEARDLFIRWYKREAQETIPERMDHYSQKLHLYPKAIRITSAQFRWGSCSRDNRLSFSWRVIMAPLSIVDYVLLHELAHIKEKNHSRSFWGYLESILPDYKRRQLWLKENGRHLRW